MKENKVLIIAEAGVNHNGDIRIAKKLIDVAVDAGVDYVKFQTFKANTLVSRLAKKANYQKSNINNEDDFQFDMLQKLELSHSDHLELIDYCEKKKINFFSTAFDKEGIFYLNNLKLKIFKIPSGEITNYPYLKAIASLNKPVILSTGMSNMDEIKKAIEILCSENLSKKDITVLHCNTEYPTPMIDVNLKAMNLISKELNVNVGYSDHTLGIEVPVAATALGARIIEKHFTLSRKMKGPDHAASLEPSELKQMVTSIRNIEKAIGGVGLKVPSKSEIKNLKISRKSIFVKNKIKKGELFEEDKIICLRPGDGISPMEIPNLIGKVFSKNLNAYTKIDYSCFE